MATTIWTPQGDVELEEQTVFKLPDGLLAPTPLELRSGYKLPDGRIVEDRDPAVTAADQMAKSIREYRELLKRQEAEPIMLPGGRRLVMPPPIVQGAAADAWAFPDGARTDLLDGTFDIDTDSWKCGLVLSTSNIGAASTTWAGVTNEHANANGYTTGGIAVTLTLSGTTTVTVDISTDPVWTASGGSITCRWAVLYEVSGNVLAYSLLDNTPADVTATDGNTLTVAAHASGVFTLA